MSNVLITGGAGFIGSNLAEGLLGKNHSVRVLDNVSTGNASNVKGIIDKANFILGDITDYQTVKKAMEGIDYVFHLAAQVSVPASIDDPVFTEKANVIGTLSVLKAAKEAGAKKVIFSSSCAVYGETGDLPIKESSRKTPMSPYAVSKLAGEEYCQLYKRLFGLESVCLRYFNVYGPRQNPRSQYAAAVPKFIELILQGKQPTIFGDGKQTRDFIFVKDVARANIQAMESKAGGIFNIGSGRKTTVNELAEKIARLAGKSIKPFYAPPRSGDIRNSLADMRKAKKRLGFEPEFSLDNGLKETIEWFRKA